MASSGSISSLSTSLSGTNLTINLSASVSGDNGYSYAKASMGTARMQLFASVVGNYGYAIGGYTTTELSTNEKYDIVNNSWSGATSLPSARRLMFGGSVGSNIYVLGGYAGGALNANSVYNSSTNNWASGSVIPNNQYNSGADVYNGKIYIVGGFSEMGGGYLNSHYVYDPSIDSWSSKASLPTATNSGKLTTYGNYLYFCGGETNGYVTVANCYKYDPSTNTWSTIASLPNARQQHAQSAINGKIYVLGGNLGSSPFSTIYSYSTSGNNWNTLNNLTYAVVHVGFFTSSTTPFVVGGSTNGSNYVNYTQEFYTEGYITLTISSLSQTVTLSQSSSTTLDISSLSNGSYTLTAKLYDSAGTLLDTKTTNVLIVTKYDIQASGLLAINSSSAISPFTQVSAQAIYKVNSLSLPNMIALTQAVGNTTFSVSVVSVPIEELITRGQILLSSSSIAQAVEGVMVIGGILLSSSSIAQAVEGVMVIGGILLSSSSIAQVVDNITTTSDTSFSSLSFYDSTCPIIARGLFILSSINGVGYFTETRATALSDFTSLSREQYIVQTSASGEIMHLSVSNINGLSYMFGLGTFSSSSMLQENLVVCLYSSEEILPILVTSSNVSQVIDNTAASGDVSFNSSVFSNCASLFASQGDFVFVSQGLISQVSEIQSIGLIENLSSPICQYVVQTLSSGQSLFNSQSAVNEFAPIYSMSKIALSTLLNENILANIHSASTISFSGIMSPNLFTCASFSGSFTTEATSIQELIYPTYSEGYTMFISNATINRTTEAKSAAIMTLHNTLLEQYVYGCRSIGIVLFIVSQKVVFCANALSNGHFTFTTLANPVIGKSLLVQDKVFLRTQSDTIGVHIKDDIVSVRLIPDDIAPKEVSK